MGSNVRFISLSEIFVAIDLYTKNRTVFYRYNSTIVEPEKLAVIVVMWLYFRAVL